MAESARRSDAKKGKGKAKDAPLDDPQLQRHERLTLVLFLEGAVAIIAGMVLLSEFLSQGSPSKPVWITAAILLGLLAVGILVTWLLRRKGDQA